MTDPQICLEARDLSVRYGGRPAVSGVGLRARRGRILAIVGPSGCGKSTVLACFNRLHDLNPACELRGSIRLDGLEILRPGLDVLALRRRVGLIVQRPNPLPLSIGRNLTFPLRHHGMGRRADRQDAARRALQRVGLWEEVKDRLGRPASELSGGQQQRLCLARALVLEPEVLLLDEPCSALDPLASGVVEALVASLRGSVTILIVTHNLAQARRLADDVAVFWNRDGVGYLEEQGSADAVFASPRSETTAAYLGGARG
ncbi:MAG: phosphate ABC transporter ATP-binding protein [Cyanobacteriota bacterium]